LVAVLGGRRKGKKRLLAENQGKKRESNSPSTRRKGKSSPFSNIPRMGGGGKSQELEKKTKEKTQVKARSTVEKKQNPLNTKEREKKIHMLDIEGKNEN